MVLDSPCEEDKEGFNSARLYASSNCLADLQFAIETTQDYCVQQFTGLKDKTGREIYEGDIVLISKGKLGEQKCTIEWGNTGFVLLSVPEYNPSIPMELDWNFATEIEIVGNIYENSKLLESKSL